MHWLQLTLESDADSARQLADILERFSSTSISLSAVSDEKLFAQSIEADATLWQQTRVTALLHEDIDLDTLLVCLLHQVGDDKISKHEIKRIADRDWINEFQSNHEAMIFSERLCICPSWCESPKNESDTLYLDPGLAFGTGTHQTTAACLEWLTTNDITDKSVIDYGCGSGILALTAIKLGAKKVYAIDIDPQALQACQHNAEKNALTDTLIISHPDNIQLPIVDILVANILLQPLQTLAQHFANLVRPTGDIVLSGLLATQVTQCSKEYQDWFTMAQPIFKQEWTLLHGIRNTG